MHAGRSKALAMLRFCHPQADPETRRYEYLEANACHCQVIIFEILNMIFICNFDYFFFPTNHTLLQTCSTTDTSCEAPNNFRDESSVKVLSMAGVNADDLEY